MRWTVGFACLSIACFSEGAGSPSGTASNATESSSSTLSTGSSSTGEPTSTDTSDSGTTATTTADTSSTAATTDDATTGGLCGAGMVPNPPPPPPDWVGPVFVSEDGERTACPEGSTRVATGLDLPQDADQCECVCDAPYEEICNPFFAGGSECPIAVPINTLIDEPCEVLFDDQVAFTGDASGISCAATPVVPPADRIEICGVEAVDGPCIDELPGFLGPCLFQAGDHQCPDPLERVDAGRDATCTACSPCTLGTHCTAAQFQVFASEDCSGAALVTFGDDMCHAAEGAGSIRVIPTVALGCFPSSLTVSELTVCCPPMP